ncbi:hypothetical protein ACSFA2_16730 [Variovorax sp. LT2P21]|uniref:hypothetical protein n=1 Tax=Variovorax sp. LT2P21 TaxID=3443731 RepID=UPI003F451C2F
MTAAKATFRSRRRSGSNVAIPKPITDWFAGDRDFSFHAYTWPWRYVLADLWDIWLSDHPGTVPDERLRNLLSRTAGATGGHLSELTAMARKETGIDPKRASR